MKTVVTIPDKLISKIDKRAERLGVSRSKVLTQAIQQYFDAPESDKASKEQDLKSNYDDVYSRNSSKVDPMLMKAQIDTLKKVDPTW